ncbi:MAG: 50S ribosomal protein L18 [Clostridiales bacterium]|nr:50S ribosomal protein L18 [Clostridiales bacterium]
MIHKPSRGKAREKRHYRLRRHLSGTPDRPRLAVFRSNKHMYAQIIDDVAGHTLAAASTTEKPIAAGLEKTSNKEAARAVGEAIAKRAVEKGINAVVFDRAGYIYHGKVQALAEAAREAGLQF